MKEWNELSKRIKALPFSKRIKLIPAGLLPIIYIGLPISIVGACIKAFNTEFLRESLASHSLTPFMVFVILLITNFWPIALFLLLFAKILPGNKRYLKKLDELEKDFQIEKMKGDLNG